MNTEPNEEELKEHKHEEPSAEATAEADEEIASDNRDVVIGGE